MDFTSTDGRLPGRSRGWSPQNTKRGVCGAAAPPSGGVWGAGAPKDQAAPRPRRVLEGVGEPSLT